MDRAIKDTNKRLGTQIGLHIDGASGAFVAPFTNDLGFEWDFNLDSVLSISASGHKFGQASALMLATILALAIF